MINVIKKCLIVLLIFSISFLLSNCVSSKKDENALQLSDDELYNKGLVYLQNKDFKNAILEFDEVSLNHPFSSLTSKSEIMSAYSLYQNNELKKAITKLNNFIEMNPKGELTQYAHYLKAMCYYAQISSTGRDTGLSMKALKHFKIIISKYPNTKYAKDSKFKIQYLKTNLAKNELNIGKFYLKKGAPASSIKRFKSILQNYQNTSIIPETLFRLSEALLFIGLKEEAIKSTAILNYNFPNNNWAKQSKKLFEKKLDLAQVKDSKTSLKDYLKKIFE